MSGQSEALRLAEILDQYEATVIDIAEATLELRKLHAENARLKEAVRELSLQIEIMKGEEQ